MKVALSATGVLALAGLAGLALGGAWLYSRRSAIGSAVNPASPDNVVNRAISAAGASMTGDPTWSLGGQLADWFSPSVREANEMVRGTWTPRPASPLPTYGLTIGGTFNEGMPL